MADLFDFMIAQPIAYYYTELQSNERPYIGQQFFPPRKKAGITLEWIRGRGNLPIILKPNAFDAKPLVRDRQGIEIESTKMPFFRESMRIGENDRQMLIQFGENTRNNPYAREIINRIFDDAANLLAGASVVPEVMRMSIIVNGQFSMATPANSGHDVAYTYNYDPDGTWAANNITTLTGTDVWSDYTNSTPIEDLIELMRNARQLGYTLRYAVMGFETFLDLTRNVNIRTSMNPSLGPNNGWTDNQIRTFIEQQTGLTLLVYDKQYTDSEDAAQFFYPQRGNVTLLPAEPVGSTWYGTTPEEADLMGGLSDADVSIVDTGVAICTKMESLPVNRIVWASEIVLPSFERMDAVYNITYTA